MPGFTILPADKLAITRAATEVSCKAASYRMPVTVLDGGPKAAARTVTRLAVPIPQGALVMPMGWDVQ